MVNSVSSWVNWISYVNTGTYNSQWMIIDYHKFNNSIGKSSLETDTFFMLEQIPGKIQFADMSDKINEVFYYNLYLKKNTIFSF